MEWISRNSNRPPALLREGLRNKWEALSEELPSQKNPAEKVSAAPPDFRGRTAETFRLIL